MNPTHPFLSVIIPVKDGHDVLATALRALAESDLPRECWELIVVDDVSRDDSASIAGEFADVVIRLSGRSHGPGYSRNRGAERARGECLVFLDADVCVHRGTLRALAHLLATQPDIAAAFGSHDDAPAARGFVSQYRNLLHHWTHGQNPGEAHTFWAGCGIVRRDVFVAAGMYDEWRFPRPQVEDIELGHRIRTLGHRIVLRPEVQVTHLKQWTLGRMIAADFRDRGVPWARLLVEDRASRSPNMVENRAMSLRIRERVNTIAVGVASLLLAVSFLNRSIVPPTAAGVLLAAVLLANRPLYAFFKRKRGVAFALGVLPLHLLYYFINGCSTIWGWFLVQLFGEPTPDPSVAAFAEVGVEMWPPVPRNPKQVRSVPVVPRR
jgi:glycosyltransferase involved in cell wall biosynthesis